MNYVLLFVLLLFLFFYSNKEYMTRANSFDISKYMSNTYPCVNEHTQEPHFRP